MKGNSNREIKIIPCIAKILDEILFDLDKFFAANSHFTTLRNIQFFNLQLPILLGVNLCKIKRMARFFIVNVSTSLLNSASKFVL